MMKEILITSSVLILALLVIRQIFRGTVSRQFLYALWALVLVRLLAPFSLFPASDFSVLTATQPMEQAVEERVGLNRIFYSQPQGRVSREELEERNIDPEDIPTSQDLFAMGESDPDNRFSTHWLVRDPESGAVTRYAEMTVGPWDILDRVWKAGMALMGLFFLFSNLGFYRRLRKKREEWRADGDIGPYGGSVKEWHTEVVVPHGGSRRVYVVPDGVIPSPCLFGWSIYITPAVAGDPAKLRHVLCHEETHARHWDPLWALLRCVCLTVYWFDPLVWVAARCSRTDCELACDEGALRVLGEAERIPYGKTLLSLIPVKRVSNPMIAATTMTAGKRQLKDRVSRIARQPRQVLAAALAVTVLVGIVSACTFTGGTSGETATEPSPSQGPTESTVRPLTGEELLWFNEEFFNGPEQDEYGFSPYNLRNQFANPGIRYDRPEDIDLYELLYLEGGSVSEEELSIVWAGDGGIDDLPCPAYKLTGSEIDAILTEYTGLTLAETNRVGLENFTYSEKYDTYYSMHGDTNYCGDLSFPVGTREGDIVKLYHSSDFAGTDWYCVTLEEVKGERAESSRSTKYHFVSNVQCEKPAIPTPLPAWEPEITVPPEEFPLYTAPFSAEERIDLNGDGSDEFLSNEGFFFQWEGQIYEVKFADLTDRFPGQIETLSLDRYGKFYMVRGCTDSHADWVRYLYFDGKDLLIYKNEKPTTDHMVAGADEGVPEAVVEAARDFSEKSCTQANIEAKEGELAQLMGSQMPGQPPAEYDDWRINYFDGPYTYSYGGATVEGWWFNYEMHTTTPESIVLAGGKYITEDNWVSPGYPGCDALFFEVKDDSYRLLSSSMVQESPGSYYVNEQVLRMMEDNGVELPDGSTYAQLSFQKVLGHLTDPAVAGDEMRIQYDDGQGNGGTYLVNPREGNGPYYQGQMKDNYVVWSWAEAPAAQPQGPSVTLSSSDWYEVIQFWRDSSLVMYKQENRDPLWFEVAYDGDPAQDVYAYRAYPYHWARGWFDDAEHERYANIALGDHGDGDYREIASAFLALYEEAAKLDATPGGRYACTYVKVEHVEIEEAQPETWFPADIVDYPHFAFSYDVVFVPENQDALNTLMAGNTGEYEGNDPNVPEGAFQYSRVGSMYLMDGYWHCGGVGTG